MLRLFRPRQNGLDVRCGTLCRRFGSSRSVSAISVPIDRRAVYTAGCCCDLGQDDRIDAEATKFILNEGYPNLTAA